MTNKEAVIAFCAVSVNDGTADLELMNAGFDGAIEYNPADQIEIAKIACEVLSSMLSISSVKEGDFTLTIDREGIKNRLYFLSKKFTFSEFQPEGPTVSSPKVW